MNGSHPRPTRHTLVTYRGEPTWPVPLDVFGDTRLAGQPDFPPGVLPASVLAIMALAGGQYLGWSWLDPVMGVVGAGVILWWSYGLIRGSTRVLLDEEASTAKADAIRARIEGEADNRVTDLHLWRVGPHHLAAIISVMTHAPRHPDHYKGLLSGIDDLAHVTVEVVPCQGQACRAA